MASDDEERGPLLTERQRKHLQGGTGVDLGTAADRSERSRIRKRVRQAIMDFRFLFEHIEQKDRDKLLDGDAYERAELHDGMVAVVALFYEMHEREGWPFEELLDRAVENAYSPNGERPERTPEHMIVNDVSFDASLESPRSRTEIGRSALRKYKRGHELTDREYRVLTESEGWTDPDTDSYLSRGEIIEELRERRKERARERRRQETMDRIETDAEMFGREENPEATTLSDASDDVDDTDE